MSYSSSTCFLSWLASGCGGSGDCGGVFSPLGVAVPFSSFLGVAGGEVSGLEGEEGGVLEFSWGGGLSAWAGGSVLVGDRSSEAAKYTRGAVSGTARRHGTGFTRNISEIPDGGF